MVIGPREVAAACCCLSVLYLVFVKYIYSLETRYMLIRCRFENFCLDLRPREVGVVVIVAAGGGGGVVGGRPQPQH